MVFSGDWIFWVCCLGVDLVLDGRGSSVNR